MGSRVRTKVKLHSDLFRSGSKKRSGSEPVYLSGLNKGQKSKFNFNASEPPGERRTVDSFTFWQGTLPMHHSHK